MHHNTHHARRGGRMNEAEPRFPGSLFPCSMPGCLYLMVHSPSDFRN